MTSPAQLRSFGWRRCVHVALSLHGETLILDGDVPSRTTLPSPKATASELNRRVDLPVLQLRRLLIGRPTLCKIESIRFQRGRDTVRQLGT